MICLNFDTEIKYLKKIVSDIISYYTLKDGEALYSQQKQDQDLTVAQIMNSILPNSDLNLKSRENQ